MVVGEMIDRMTAAELCEWQAYYQLKAKEQEQARKRSAARKKR